MKRVVIIGAGIAGLSTAYGMREHSRPGSEPFEILLIEAKDEPGGNIRTERVGGFLIEGGPDCFLSEKPWAMELCKRLGMEDRLLMTNEEKRKTFVLSRGRLHELPEGVILMVPTKMTPLAFSSLITIGGKIRMAMELFVPKRREKGDETLGSFVRRRLGQEALDKIAEPLVAGVHAGDPDTMSVRASFPKFVQLEEEHGSLIRGMLRRMASMKSSAAPSGAAKGPGGKRPTMFVTLTGGLGTLVAELMKRLGQSPNTSVRCGSRVREIKENGRGGYVVVPEQGDPVEADAVVIAAPAYAAASVLKGYDPKLSERLLTIPYVSTATVSIGFKRSEITHPLNGFGFVVPKTEKRKIMAATWTSVKFKHRAPEDSVLIRCFLGGAKDQQMVDLSDDAMIKTVRKELKEIMGITAEPVVARVFRWRNSMPQYTVGHEERVAAIDELTAAHPGLYLTGSAYHGIGIADSVRNAEITAKKVLHRVLGG